MAELSVILHSATELMAVTFSMFMLSNVLVAFIFFFVVQDVTRAVKNYLSTIDAADGIEAGSSGTAKQPDDNREEATEELRHFVKGHCHNIFTVCFLAVKFILFGGEILLAKKHSEDVLDRESFEPTYAVLVLIVLILNITHVKRTWISAPTEKESQ